MKKSFVIFLIIIAILFIISNFYIIEEVKTVIDGDTIKLKDGKIVRLLGINAPEVDEECYQESREELKSLLKGKTIRLESDSTERDTYGRLLRYVFVDDIFVNGEMVRLGYAKVFGNAEKYSEILIEMEDKARKAKRCIWKN